MNPRNPVTNSFYIIDATYSTIFVLDIVVTKQCLFDTCARFYTVNKSFGIYILKRKQYDNFIPTH